MGAGLGDAAVLDQVVVADDLGFDKAALKVGVDDAGGLRRGPALVDRPGARLLLPRRQVGLQAEGVEADPRQLVEPGLVLPGGLQHLAGFGGLELCELGLELRVEEDRLGRSHEIAQFGLHGLVGQAGVVGVEDVDEGLGGHQAEALEDGRVEVRPARGEHPALLQEGQRGLRGLQDVLGRLLSRHLLDQARNLLLQRLHVRQDELGRDGFDVPLRIDAALDVHDVRVGERAGDHADRVRLANVGQELVAQALPLGGAAHDSRDVHEAHGCGDDLA